MKLRLGFLAPLATAFSKTFLGRKYTTLVLSDIGTFLDQHPELCLQAIQKWYNERSQWDRALERVKPPYKAEHLEDLDWLFASHIGNMDLAQLAFDEAAYLFRLIRGLPSAAQLVELGRYKGGSTFLVAAAMKADARLRSIDNHGYQSWFDHKRVDASLRQALEKFHLAQKVHIEVADSATAPFQPGSCDLVFIDGDHSYEGSSRDYRHWKRAVKPGGHLLFHDAANHREFANPVEGSVRFMQEITRADQKFYTPRPAAGSLSHFIRTETPFPPA